VVVVLTGIFSERVVLIIIFFKIRYILLSVLIGILAIGDDEKAI